MSQYSIRPTPAEDHYPGYSKNFPFQIVDEYGRNCGVYRSREEAEGRKSVLEFEAAQPVGVRTSPALVAVRRVLSLAETHAAEIFHYGKEPEELEIFSDLQKVVNLLDRWGRTGRMPKRPKS